MTNKLTSEKLKELIEQVLKEEKQQLDEININIPKGIGKIRKDFGFDDKTNLSSGTAWRTQKSDISSLGALDKDATDVTDADLEAAFTTGKGTEFNVADWLMKNSTVTNVKQAATDAYNKVNSSPPPKKTGASGGGVLARYGLTTKSSKTQIKNAILAIAKKGSTATAQEKQDAQDLNNYLFTLYSSTPSKTSAYNKCKEAIAAMTGSSPSSQQFKVALQKLTSSLKAMDAGDVPFTRPTVYTTPSEEGKYPAELISSFDTVLKGAQTIEERVERISLVSEAMVSGDPLTFMTNTMRITNSQDQKRFLLSMLMVVDYIAAFAKYFDHGGGAYLFEAFCSLITGGGVIGKGMDSGDFTITAANGTKYKGSSKYYKDGSTMEQAGSGFKINEPVTYIVAQKRGLSVGKAGKLGTKVGATSDVRGLTEIGIFIGDITVTGYKQAGKAVDNITLDTSNAGDLEFSVANTKAKNITIKAKGAPTHTVYLADATAAKGNFKKSVEDVMSKQNAHLKKAFAEFKNFIEASMKVDTLTKKYIDSGTNADGNDALKATEQLDQMQVNLINDIKGSTQKNVSTISSAGTRTLEENKKSQTKSIKDLDKLIERVILESMNKK